jgi:hypothetical protein
MDRTRERTHVLVRLCSRRVLDRPPEQRARVFQIRTLYGTLAFPWLLLKLPLAYTA